MNHFVKCTPQLITDIVVILSFHSSRADVDFFLSLMPNIYVALQSNKRFPLSKVAALAKLFVVGLLSSAILFWSDDPSTERLLTARLQA
jgi:hypothetical protein